MQFRNQGCEACTNNGGGYCELGDGTPVCSSAEIAVQVPEICTSGGGTPYTPFCGDTCDYQFDLECDADKFCVLDSDIFDCDPFQQFRFSGCEVCVANGGRYCETGSGTRICSSPDIAEFVPAACLILGAVLEGQFAGTPYMSSCGGSGDSGGGSSGGLAALSVLVLIPIAGISYFIYW